MLVSILTTETHFLSCATYTGFYSPPKTRTVRFVCTFFMRLVQVDGASTKESSDRNSNGMVSRTSQTSAGSYSLMLSLLRPSVYAYGEAKERGGSSSDFSREAAGSLVPTFSIAIAQLWEGSRQGSRRQVFGAILHNTHARARRECANGGEGTWNVGKLPIWMMLFVLLLCLAVPSISRGCRGHDDFAPSPRCEGTEQEVCIATGCRHTKGGV